MARLFWSAAILAALFATPGLCAQAVVDGWAGYKFGMSPDAARAVPGQSFGRYSPKDLMDRNAGAMGATTTPVLNGINYALNLFFDSDRLNGISLENEKKASATDCQKIFLSVLGQLEKNYGGFAAVNPQHPRKDGETPPTAVEWRQQGASHYQVSTVSLDDETAFAWKARKTAGGNYADVASTWSGKDGNAQMPCVTAITYSGH